MIDLLAEHLCTEVPEVLWHYTSFETLKRICESQALWASDILFMNDKEEYIDAQKMLTPVIQALPEGTDIERRIKESATNLLNDGIASSELHSKVQLFAASFTAQGDDRVQWEIYGDRSKGAALGFNLRQIKPEPRDKVLSDIGPCIYDDGTKELLIESVVRRFAAELETTMTDAKRERQLNRKWRILYPKFPRFAHEEQFEVWALKHYQNDIDRITTEFFRNLLWLYALCKNHSFYKEEEWRLFVTLGKGKWRKLTPHVREGAFGITEYFPCSLRKQGQRFPLVKVRVGPRANFEETRSLLHKHFPEIEVLTSQIPLR